MTDTVSVTFDVYLFSSSSQNSPPSWRWRVDDTPLIPWHLAPFYDNTTKTTLITYHTPRRLKKGQKPTTIPFQGYRRLNAREPQTDSETVYSMIVQGAPAGSTKQIVKLLLDKGADIDTVGGYHGTPLQAATARGHEQIVKLLLDKGADVNAVYHGTALQAASVEAHEKIVKLALDKGARSQHMR